MILSFGRRNIRNRSNFYGKRDKLRIATTGLISLATWFSWSSKSDLIGFFLPNQMKCYKKLLV